MNMAIYKCIYFTYSLNHQFFHRYNVQWYVAPLRIQKMLLFLLQRGTKSFNLNLGGLFVGSLESAAMVKNILCITQNMFNEKIF